MLTLEEQRRRWRECSQRYRLAHPERTRQSDHKRHVLRALTKPRVRSEKEKATAQRWAKTHKDKTRAASKRWRLAHPEKQKAMQRAWRLANPEKVRARDKARGKSVTDRLLKKRRDMMRRARVKDAPKATAEELKEIQERQKGRCFYCKRKAKLTLDHVIPVAKGGTSTAENIVFACRPCNSAKRDKIWRIC